MTADTGLNYTPKASTTLGDERLFADRPLYSNFDRTKLLEEGDPEAAFIVAGVAGQPIREDFVRDLGLTAKSGKIVQGDPIATAAGDLVPIVTHSIAAVATQERLAAEKAASNDEGVVQPDKFAAELAKNDDAAAAVELEARTPEDAPVKEDKDASKDKSRKGSTKTK